MKNAVPLRNTLSFVVLFAGFALALQPRTITVSGVVVDSITREPAGNAVVLMVDTSLATLTNINLSTLPYDTAYTGSDGSFSKSITTSNPILFYAVVKAGYAFYLNMSYAMASPTVTTVRLDTIRIVPVSHAAKDTITVSGKVVDSTTSRGIPDAFVGVSGADLDTTGKTLRTNADGNFTGQVIITKVSGLSLSVLGYIAYKPGYNQITGYKMLTTKTVDLGTIKLSQNTAVRRMFSGSAALHGSPTTMNVYSLDGRLVYTGPVVRNDLLRKNASSPLLVEFREKGATAVRQKLMPYRR